MAADSSQQGLGDRLPHKPAQRHQNQEHDAPSIRRPCSVSRGTAAERCRFEYSRMTVPSRVLSLESTGTVMIVQRRVEILQNQTDPRPDSAIASASLAGIAPSVAKRLRRRKSLGVGRDVDRALGIHTTIVGCPRRCCRAARSNGVVMISYACHSRRGASPAAATATASCRATAHGRPGRAWPRRWRSEMSGTATANAVTTITRMRLAGIL